MRLIFFILVILSIDFGICKAQVNIVVNKGPFQSVSEASVGEDKVDFNDNDLADERACTESFAATELARYLPKATRTKVDEIKFITTNTLPKKGTIFILGSRFSNSLLSKYEIHKDAAIFTSEQSYRILSFKEDERIITIIEGSDRIGVLYGVYRYLYELGVKFIGLGVQGTVFPIYPQEIPIDLDIKENPSYLTRGFYAWGDRKVDKDFFFWMARNNLNYWTAENQPIKFLKKLGIKLSDGGHRVQAKVFNSDDEYPYNHPIFNGDDSKPSDPYKVGDSYMGDINGDGKLSNFEAHPEWYGMKDGRRIKIFYSAADASQHTTNFCTSNEDARKEFARRVVRQLAVGDWKNVDVFEFWMFDGGESLWCECNDCKKSGSFTDRMFTVTYEIQKELDRSRFLKGGSRHLEISSIAYWATIDPPTLPLPADFDYKLNSVTFFPIRRCYVHAFGDPNCTEVNQDILTNFQGWTIGSQRFYKGPIFIGEYYNLSLFKSLPLVFTKIMAVDIPWYYRQGARQFNYMHTPTTLLGTWNLNQYLLGKLLWNVNTNVNSIINEYFHLYYPTTSGPTREFYKELEEATSNIEIFKNYAANRLLKGSPFQLNHLHYDEYHPLTDDGLDVLEIIDVMEKAKKYLDESLMECNDSIEQQRLIEDKIRFDYGYVMYRYIYHMIRTSFFHEKGDKVMAAREFLTVKDYASKLEDMTEVVQGSSEHANAKNGLEAAGSVKLYKMFSELYDK